MLQTPEEIIDDLGITIKGYIDSFNKMELIANNWKTVADRHGVNSAARKFALEQTYGILASKKTDTEIINELRFYYAELATKAEFRND